MPKDAMTEDQQLRALLRMKRYEQPPAGYYEKLLQDVHRRQRSELLKRPLWAIAMERVQTFFSEHSMGGLSYAGAMAAVAVAGLLAINGSSKAPAGSTPTVMASAMTPASVEVMAPAPALVADAAEVAKENGPTNLRADATAGPRLLSLQNAPVVMADSVDEVPVTDARLIPARAISTEGVSRQPRYVIDNRPVSYEATKVSFSF